MINEVFLSLEKTESLVLRTVDWSETSRISTLWTKNFGKVRALAKGGRRLKSSFENALDLLTHCNIVLLRKTSGSLDLLTEAQVLNAFLGLRKDLNALHASYYLAELLSDWTEDYDPNPVIFEQALLALTTWSELGNGKDYVNQDERQGRIAAVLFRFEFILLLELGFRPELKMCTGCSEAVKEFQYVFSPAGGGVKCRTCSLADRTSFKISSESLQVLISLEGVSMENLKIIPLQIRKELRKIFGRYITYLMGRRPKLLTYLEAGCI